MKNINFFLLIINFCLSFENSEANSDLKKKSYYPKIKCNVGKMQNKSEIFKKKEKQRIYNDNQRNLGDNDFDTIRIYLSTDYFNIQMSLVGSALLSKAKEHLNNVIGYIKKLIKVKPLQRKIVFRRQQQVDWNITLETLYDKTLEAGVSYDLVVIPVIGSDDFISSKSMDRDTNTKRNTIAKLEMPLELFKTKGQNAKFYIESLLLHEFTHILGFSIDSFQYFPGGLDSTIKKQVSRGRERYFVITEKVAELAQKYYGCDSIIGLELEDQDDNELPSPHWEARILLGEYMNLELYRPEVVISDFTLALLEDSGWYKVNYYTGGLMRFGKNKGCSFLNDECSNSQGITSFKNEFFDLEDNENPSCSSGRISRTYCDTKNYVAGIPINEYIRISLPNQNNYGGKTINADYCFGFIQYDDEEENYLYSGNCNFGNGIYGSRIKYNDDLVYPNSANEKELYEKYSQNSFCVLSEAYPSSSYFQDKYFGIVHPICYEMFCSDKTLAIKIKDQYIICPREGGKVEVNGDFEGYIYCPDYNLICTGTVLCNDMFDCIDKKSESKTPNYDYSFNAASSSQKISSIKNYQPIIGYELDESGICPINCGQCKDKKKCFKCRENYNLIGTKENDDNPINCDNQKDITVGYYNKNGVYYPCIDFCVECDNSNTCKTCDNIHKVDANSKCVDKVANCETYDNIDFTCTKCKNGYYFIKEDRENCYNNINKDKYFTLDNGLSYYPCDTNISNCDECENKSNSCSKCKNNYYFLKNNRTFCFNNLDLTKYYSRDNGISYFLCNESISKCQSCSYNNNLKCDLCEKDYYFLENNRDTCVTGYDLTKYYSEDNGKSYIPCYKGFSQCEICNNDKTTCQKCNDGYYFIGINKDQCLNNFDLDKYFTEDGGISYIPCDTFMEGCDKCSSRNVCNSCKRNYYFVERQRNRCYAINLENYYKEDDDYFPCNKSIEYCNKCNVKDSCIECNQNYYFIEDDRTYCDTGKNLKKYYTNDNGISYYPCDKTMENCDECYSDQFCYLCKSLYFLKFENSKECFLDNNLKKEKTYYRLNSTHYKKCSDNIMNCDICSSGTECTQCLPNNYFLDDDHTTCVNIINIDIEEYYEYDNYNYHKCSRLIENCEKCTNPLCDFCYANYTLVNDNYEKCLPKEDYKIGYYQNQKGNMYYSCIDNCDKCVNGNECIECANNYTLLGDRTSCGSCMIVEEIVDDELSLENMDKLVQTYISRYINNFDVAMVYSNPDLNITLTIFRTWQCTELLLDDQYYRINVSELIEKLRKKTNKSGKSFIYSMLNYNYKSYFEVYDLDLNRKIDIKNECPECLRVEYEIKNNYTSEITHFIGSKLSKMVNKYNINVLNSSDPYFNDACKNVDFESIDISMEQRRKILYLGDKLKIITCLDNDCTLNSVLYNESIGNCRCKFNFDFEKLLSNTTDDTNNNDDLDENDFKPISGINPFPVFTCYEEAFNSKTISSNVGLYIGGVVIVAQIISFIILIIKYCKRKKIVKNIASPPPKDVLKINKKYKIKDDTEKETQAKDKEYDSYYDNADPEKKVQDRDEFDEDFENDESDVNSKYFKNTHLSEEDSINGSRKDDIFISNRQLNDFNMEQINPDQAGNNFSKLSEIKKDTTEELDYSNTSKKSSTKESLDLSEDEIFSLIKNNKEKLDLDYVILSEAIKKDERTLCELYTHLLALKQPIWDMLSEIKALEINKSFVPLSMKIIRFLFMLGFNMFINSLFLTQNYFKKKYTYFNKKYNIQYNESIQGISSNEKFAYAIRNTIGFSIATFFICIIVQFLINYYFFNLRRRVWTILKECDDDAREEIKEINKFFNDKNCCFIVIAFINFIFMIFFFFYIVNFSQVFKGGVLDYIGGTFMTWLFLQVAPFISCLISASFRYFGLKKENNRLYKLNQVYIF